MKIEEIYSDPMDNVRFYVEDQPVYESLEDIQSSHGSLSNILGSGNQKPPLAPTPVLKRRQPLTERSNLPPVNPANRSSSSKHSGLKSEKKYNLGTVGQKILKSPGQKNS